MFGVAQQMAAALRRSGLLLRRGQPILADGEAAFQEVFHVHLHVIPRNPGDGFRIRAKWRHPARAELDSVAQARYVAPGNHERPGWLPWAGGRPGH